MNRGVCVTSAVTDASTAVNLTSYIQFGAVALRFFAIFGIIIRCGLLEQFFLPLKHVLKRLVAASWRIFLGGLTSYITHTLRRHLRVMEQFAHAALNSFSCISEHCRFTPTFVPMVEKGENDCVIYFMFNFYGYDTSLYLFFIHIWLLCPTTKITM